jgi:hypothetical protein
MTEKYNSYMLLVRGRTVKFVDRDTGKMRVVKRTAGDGLEKLVPISRPRRSRRGISRASAEAEIRRIMEGQR